MTAREINENALTFLSEQKWLEAQELFFYNARKNPSHQTYNNLGYYLITEGLSCKNGSCRNAHKLGMKYLLKASGMKDTVVNIAAIVKTLHDELCSATVYQQKSTICHQALSLLQKALAIAYSDELQYNFYLFQYLLGEDTDQLIKEMRPFLKRFACEESVGLYFELLRTHSLWEEGMNCIEQYGAFLDAAELLLFYADSGQYEKGYCLCPSILEEWSVDKVLACAMIECCVETNHFEEAKTYAERIEECEREIQYKGKEEWPPLVLNNLTAPSSYRKEIISNYRAGSPFMDSCCYFGCKKHETAWC